MTKAKRRAKTVRDIDRGVAPEAVQPITTRASATLPTFARIRTERIPRWLPDLDSNQD